jgi:ketosteroid isomerase-like protein
VAHPNEALLRQAYEAQSRGDLETYLRFLSDDIVFHIPGRSRIAGDYVGRDEVRRHFRQLKELTGGTFRTGVHDVVANDDHAVALINAHGRRGDRSADLPRVHVWHVRGGNLAELWLHPTDQYTFDDFWH